MFKFPPGFYTDVRIEHIFETIIVYTLGRIDDCKTRDYKAAFIRLFDGCRWYYSALSDLDSIQGKIDVLASYAKSDPEIGSNPVVSKFEVQQGSFWSFKNRNLAEIAKSSKNDLLQGYFKLLKRHSNLKMWKAFYMDRREEKNFYSSKGSSLSFDMQRAGIGIIMSFARKKKTYTDFFMKAGNTFEELSGHQDECEGFIEKCEDFLKRAKAVKPGKYTVILSPEAAGIFAHESFGHKSEADFMVGDETMKNEWKLGRRVGSGLLTIIDDGNYLGSGYVPFDDEGTRARKTELIKDGILKSRLHSAVTAAMLDEGLTGNARAINFEYEPLVRMTTTYILPGNLSKEELFSDVKEGIYVEKLKHGSGMSTFTLAPSLAYHIKNGKIAEPLTISVITGNVFETLAEIDGLSNDLEIFSFVGAGCGKMEQSGLPVGFGGPYVRVKSMNVQ
ncbi:TldD/PmbA family protein [bacterium]|nr:TldD/PmbA family protein [bacterium]